jgi:hypothetical protein
MGKRSITEEKDRLPPNRITSKQVTAGSVRPSRR